MWNPVPFCKRYCRPCNVSRQESGLLVGLILVAFAFPGAAGGDVSGARAGVRPGVVSADQGFQLPGVAAPELAKLFTPRNAPDGAYQVTVVEASLFRALDLIRRSLPPGYHLATTAGAWRAVWLDPLDAFGRSGSYDRAKVAQLYLGRKVQVARGPVEREGRVVGALTLFWPYPDATLTRLEPRTLAILLRTGE